MHRPMRRYANFRICGIISAYAILKTQLYVENMQCADFATYAIACAIVCSRIYNRYPYNCASVQRELLAPEILNESFLKCRYFTALQSRDVHGLDSSMDWIGLDWVR